ncbi:uncharacterized protein LOC111307000 [Durio zibethinus]|uniref:Uncharacterized protein LOC111307000 n=1 Tax=Durio zibethinus TaxID=66656 RepID=A0A6P6A794_DURZI|nr:uncharacterized protein LOC111307000 [Durio zibethinus]
MNVDHGGNLEEQWEAIKELIEINFSFEWYRFKMELIFRNKIEPLFASAVDLSVARNNLYVSSVIGIILRLLPRKNIGGNTVPLLFEGQPSAFYALVISVVFTFTGSFTALMIGDSSKTSRFCTLYSLVAMILALSILAHVFLS